MRFRKSFVSLADDAVEALISLSWRATSMLADGCAYCAKPIDKRIRVQAGVLCSRLRYESARGASSMDFRKIADYMLDGRYSGERCRAITVLGESPRPARMNEVAKIFGESCR